MRSNLSTFNLFSYEVSDFRKSCIDNKLVCVSLPTYSYSYFYKENILIYFKNFNKDNNVHVLVVINEELLLHLDNVSPMDYYFNLLNFIVEKFNIRYFNNVEYGRYSRSEKFEMKISTHKGYPRKPLSYGCSGFVGNSHVKLGGW